MSGEAESSKEMSPLLWGRPASGLEGALSAAKRKKERKKENEKLMREEESQGGRKSRRGKAEKEVGEEGREEKREM